jgi:hypothetical protein
MTRIYIENYELDLTSEISQSITYAIDDLRNLDAKSTAFTKTIVIPGTAKNNLLFGSIFELSNANAPGGAANVFYDFDASRSAQARIEINGLQAMKGTMRLLSIVVDRDRIEYEVALFGELGGFISQVGIAKLEDLDFSAYNHNWNYQNIINTFFEVYVAVAPSYTISGPLGTELYDTVYQIQVDINASTIQAGDIFKITSTGSNDGVYQAVQVIYFPNLGVTNILVFDPLTPESGTFMGLALQERNGFGYTYPLIDYGVSDNVGAFELYKDWQFRTFRPAFYVKEYLHKIITGAGYTYESVFMDSPFFKSLIIPNNDSGLIKLEETFFVEADDDQIDVTLNKDDNGILYSFDFANTPTLTNFNYGSGRFQYTGTAQINVKVRAAIDVSIKLQGGSVWFRILKNTEIIGEYRIGPEFSNNRYTFELEGITSIKNGDEFRIVYLSYVSTILSDTYVNTIAADGLTTTLAIEPDPPGFIDYDYDDLIIMNRLIPKNIYQKDFFISILKMFNLMVVEDKERDRHFIIEPYIDFFQKDNYLDWSDKVNRAKPLTIKPMSETNARLYEFKYKEDKDYFNELYKGKFNEVYGNRVFDNRLEFSKDTSKVEIIFSPSVLVGYEDVEKIFPAIYKYDESTQVKTPIAHNIRIMQTKLMDAEDWNILNGEETLGAVDKYIYAGHLNDPMLPAIDINWGATRELYYLYDGAGTLQANLFNIFYSPYMAEIVDKDSRLVSCEMKLDEIDIFNLDFSRLIYMDGVVFRLMRIRDWQAGELCKVDLLRVINTEYPTIYPSFSGGFVMRFIDMDLVDTMVGDRLSVNDWNAFFSLSGSNVFASVFQNGNDIVLTGTPFFAITDNLLEGNSNIIALWDNIGAIQSVGNFAFSESSLQIFHSKSAELLRSYAFNTCAGLYDVQVPEALQINEYCFQSCTFLKYLKMNKLKECGFDLTNEGVFDNISGQTIYLTIPQDLYDQADQDIVDLIDNNTVILTLT